MSQMLEDDAPKKKYTPTTKAYRNTDFLNSSHARLVRIMCEYEETMMRLKMHNIRATILIFGSARSKSHEEYAQAVEITNRDILNAKQTQDTEALTNALRLEKRLEKTKWMVEMTDSIEILGRLLTEWGMSQECKLQKTHAFSGVTRYHYMDPSKRLSDVPSYGIIPPNGEIEKQSVYVCTGGGPGFMEAAAKGASMVPGSRNIGMGITVPFEVGLNEHVTEELAFQFHYFFTRKFWMVYYCQAIIVAPGGYGTLDELFEVLTLKQTGKVQGDLPVVLFGKNYWQTVVNWQSFADFGTISQEEVDSLFFTDSAEEAYNYLVDVLGDKPINWEEEEGYSD